MLVTLSRFPAEARRRVRDVAPTRRVPPRRSAEAGNHPTGENARTLARWPRAEKRTTAGRLRTRKMHHRRALAHPADGFPPTDGPRDQAARASTTRARGARGHGRPARVGARANTPYKRRASIDLMSAIALPGLRCFGQVLVQFMMVWQRNSRNGSFNSSSRAPVASSRESASQR